MVYEHEGTVLHQAWHTPAGTLHERMRVTEDWEGSGQATGYLWFLDDFRPSRLLEPAIKGAADLAALEYLFPRENPADTEAMARTHAADRALADEFAVPLTTEHRAGLDWLTWMFSAAGAVLLAMDQRRAGAGDAGDHQPGLPATAGGAARSGDRRGGAERVV